MERLELLYAKMVFRLNTSKRMATCRKLASLLRNDFTLMNALGRIEMIESHGGKKPGEPFAIVMREWQKNLERGMSFSEATRGWVPPEETMLVTSGNLSDLAVALDNVGRVVDGSARIGRAMVSAVAYPMFLFALTVGIIIMVGLYLVPPLADAAGTDVVWRGAAASLIWVSDMAARWWFVVLMVAAGLMLVVWVSLRNWTGRGRVVFDKLPPWNIYKLRISVSWMMSLSAMVASGMTVPDAMRMLADGGNRYLRSRLTAALHYIAGGDNLGVALNNTGLDFPNSEIIGDLAIYSEMAGFEHNLSRVANDYLDQSVRRMDAIAGMMNSIGLLMVSGIIAWVVLGTFQMQDQITAALGV